jgi:DNA-binding CsgD family transcriptional regulator
MRGAGYNPGTIMSLSDLGDVARDRGDHARALAFYREALGLGLERPGTREVTDVIEAVGVVTVAVGRADRGARLLGAAEALRARTGLLYRDIGNQVALEHAVIDARTALGHEGFAAAWAGGRSLRPAQAVSEAIDPFERALTLLTLAERRAGEGKTADLSVVLEEVRAICVPLGAAPVLARVDVLSARLTAKSAVPSKSPGLSRRELEVLRLVSEGQTDTEVANYLSISPRTVGQHLRSVYNKLGVSTRAAATRIAVERSML